MSNRSQFSSTAVFVIGILYTTGTVAVCTAMDTDSLRSTGITIRKIQEKDFVIGDVNVFRSGNQLKIYGTGRLQSEFTRGHMDVSIKNPSGTVLASASIETEFRKRGKSSYMAKRTLYYSGNITLTDTTASVIVLAFHLNSLEKRSTTFDCGANKARSEASGK